MSEEPEFRRHRGFLDDARGGLTTFGLEFLVVLAIVAFGLIAATIIVAVVV